MDRKWCPTCGNPGPFDKNVCYSCGNYTKTFITDMAKAYKIWLDYQRIDGELREELEKLHNV